MLYTGQPVLKETTVQTSQLDVSETVEAAAEPKEDVQSYHRSRYTVLYTVQCTVKWAHNLTEVFILQFTGTAPLI